VSPAEAEALQDIRGYAGAGRVVFPTHARRRMRERGADEEDVIHALTGAASCEAEPPDRWKVPGRDRDGDPLTVVVVIEAGLIVVTLYDGDGP
jgi:hypothetical protein